jgi:hypothetical protein
MTDKKLELASFSSDSLSKLVAQVRVAQKANDRAAEQLAHSAVSAIARSEGAALEAKILTRFLTDM